MSQSAARAASVLAGLLVAVPLFGFLAPFEYGLWIQAAAVVGLVLLAALVPIISGTAASPRPWPTWLRNALVAWTAVAVWGAAMGLLAGNPPRYVVSQTVAMLLLPMAAYAFGRVRDFDGRRLLAGLTVAALAVMFALLAWAVTNGDVGRFITGRLRGIRNESLADAGLLIFALAFARWIARGGIGSVLATSVGLFMVLVGQARGQWLAALVVMAVVLLSLGLRRSTRIRGLGVLALIAILGIGVGMTRRSCDQPLPTIVDLDYEQPLAVAPVADHVPLIVETAVAGSAIEIRTTASGTPASRARMFVVGRSPRGRARFRAWPIWTGAGIEEDVRFVVPLPEGTASIGVGLEALSGTWTLHGLEIADIGGWLRPSLRRFCGRPVDRVVDGVEQRRGLEAVLRARATQLVAAIGRPLRDDTLRYRLDEGAAVMEAWSSGGVLRRGVGHGLGATYSFRNPSWNRDGESVWLDDANYVHNFYLFLLFKLGVAGLVALGALGAIIVWNLGRALRLEASRSWIHAAAAAAWIGYLTWALTSPEIIDFRIAPLLGALCAAARGYDER